MSALRDLTPLLKPRAVAILGATADARRVGGRPLSFLRRFGFPGAIYPVNPKYSEIDGARCYRSVADLPEAPDMAVIAIPAKGVIQAVRDCQAAGIPAMTIYTSGFGETGPEGRAVEAELKAVAAEGGSLICGPNCQGVANLHDRMVANFSSTLGRDDIATGPVAFVSQSGLFTGIVAGECHRRGLGLGYLISSGNEAVVDFADLLAYTAADPRTRVVAGYLEGVRDGPRLRAAARVAREHGKPIVVLKVGRSAESAAAAASHTGSLAGSYEVYRAAFRQWGVIEVEDVTELFDLIELFALDTPPSAGDRIGIVTNSGGIGVFCADQVVSQGMTMATFDEGTVARIAERIPAFGSPRNPVDFTLQALDDPKSVGWHLRQVVTDPGVDAVLMFFGVQMLNVEALVGEIVAANTLNDKPIVVGWMLGDPDGPRRLRDAGIACYDDPSRALKAIRALVRHGARPPDIHASPARPSPASKMVAEARGETSLGEDAAKQVLAAAGITVTRSILATDAEAAVAAAGEIGLPVVLKVESSDILHKTEAGAVALDLRDAASVAAAFADVTASARAYLPEARIEGVGVHEMVTGAVELIAGIKRDPTFGPVILLGAGGIMVEVMGDVALRVAPIDRAEARAMIGELAGLALLTGARGRPRADIDAVVEVLVSLSDLALATPSLAELDINPLMVLADGAGVRAADALITIAPEPV
ncbi:MAG: acetate--CoA ligase family protein [Alphaproteobacteria bacterium]|jgi:acetyltransferase|nr:acetate--CoA ligase family protein [Alphaproteobacteria bacterium]MDP6516620.1 acetate--CoA ligase family protein [Alphaproteobacteria bacterium]